MRTTVRSRLQEIIHQEQVKNPSCALASVIKTYPDEYACDIILVNNDSPDRGGIATKVPLPMISGMSYVLPHPGDKVAVVFLGNDMNYPLIVATYPAIRAQITSHSQIASSQLQHLSSIE